MMPKTPQTTDFPNPSAASRVASVGVKVYVVNTANSAASSSAVVSFNLSSSRKMVFNYDTAAAQMRRANMIANRGLPIVSTSDPN